MKFGMKNSLVLPALALAFVWTGCQKTEGPTSPANENQLTGNSAQPTGEGYAPEGRPATDVEVAMLEATKGSETVVELPAAEAPAALSKTAVLPTCTVDFNSSFSLSLMPGHCSSTFATSPFYIHQCNSSYWVYSNPVNLDHFHLVAENPNQCYGSGNNWGVQSGSSCVSQSDAMYWPRIATNMGSNTGVQFYVKSSSNVKKNFDLKAIYVNSSTMDIYVNRVGIGWWHWSGLTSPMRWYFPTNATNVSEVQVFKDGMNGTVTFDNLEVAIIP